MLSRFPVIIISLLLTVAAVRSVRADTPVAVTLYMESLCPGCQAFFAGQLYPTWLKLNASGILAVDVVPYGNAREQQQGDKWVFTCQHGDDECVGNQLETCAIRLLVSPPRWLPYLHCIEGRLANGSSDVLQVAKDCATAVQPNVNFDDISNCALSSQGNQWEHEMGLRTEALNPPHQYVPWVTVNGVHTDRIQKRAENDLLKLICDTYTGAKPKECGTFDDAAKQRCFRFSPNGSVRDFGFGFSAKHSGFCMEKNRRGSSLFSSSVPLTAIESPLASIDVSFSRDSTDSHCLDRKGSGLIDGMTLRPVVLCGPSGSGKSTLIKALMQKYQGLFAFSVSHTTRQPRPGEVDGKDYYFTDRATMQSMISRGDFIESAEFSGNFYGTSKTAVTAVAEAGKICLLDVDTQGVKTLKRQSELHPKYVFIMPPSVEVLEQRLRGRGTESEDRILARLDAAKAEIEYGRAAGNFDIVIVNDDLERATIELEEFLLEDIHLARESRLK